MLQIKLSISSGLESTVTIGPSQRIKEGISLFLIESRTLIPAEYTEDPYSLVFSALIFEGEQTLSIHSDGLVLFHEKQSLEVRDTGKVRLDDEDEIVAATMISQGNEILISTKKRNLLYFEPSRKSTNKIPIILDKMKICYAKYNFQLDALMLGSQTGSITVILSKPRITRW